MSSTRKLPRWAQFVAGGALLSIAVTAGAVSLGFNVSYGLETGGPTLALTNGLADLVKILLPIVCAAIGWNFHTRATLVLCAVISVLCVSSYLADNADREFRGRHQSSATRAGIDADMSRARAELATITETGTAESLTAAAALAERQAEAERKRGGCKDRCTRALEAATAFRDRAGQAERKIALERQIGELGGKLHDLGAPVAVSGLASITHAVIGIDIERAAFLIAGARMILSIALLELLVYLSIPAGNILSIAFRTPAKKIAKPVKSARKKVARRQAPAKASPATPAEKPVVSPDWRAMDARLKQIAKEAAKTAKRKTKKPAELISAS